MVFRRHVLLHLGEVARADLSLRMLALHFFTYGMRRVRVTTHNANDFV